MNIVELTESDPELLVFSTLLKSAGLDGALSGVVNKLPFTVFAPTNAAFGTFDLNGLLGPANYPKLRKSSGTTSSRARSTPRTLPTGS